MNRRLNAALALTLAWFVETPALAQGQDSQPYERDLMVIATLIEGAFDNANQNYFDRRGDRSVKHRRIHQVVEAMDLPALGNHVFSVTGYYDGDKEQPVPRQIWSLSADSDAASVRMDVWPAGDVSLHSADSFEAQPNCSLFWQREAAQFSATAKAGCSLPVVRAATVSNGQLWLTYAGDEADYQLHRVRPFECYVDIPGVGGGRDEPYERYEGFKIHDQAGSAWFDTKDGRRLGISLFLVDWPINNYTGVFTRDSLVVY
ncbi:MAG: hypothetical protein AAGA23_20040, partial [Pseudomonadota bacterium]